MTARYDAIADFYASVTGEAAEDSTSQTLLRLLGEVSGKRVLDAACGHGRITRGLASRGADVLGVDVSRELLSWAKSSETSAPLGAAYELVDVTDPTALESEVFDGVSCNYGLSDIDNLDGALATVARVLRPGGRFVFSILHPCFPGWDADAPSAWSPECGYYHEGWWLAANTGFRGKVGSNFRMLSTYLNALVHHGLSIDRVEEPEPPPEWANRLPGFAPVPFALVVRCIKADE